ncbi:MAG TPA: spermidine/putrescine ABC transporter substrate-binding protein [Gaiellaceae bacterium]|nr:spermidine/putrescine ABC transporter substrate-binding protein [Gaiellaceae bacterium]
MRRHPREARGLDRREFLRRSAAATLGLSGAGALLAACGGDDATGLAGDTNRAGDTVTPEDSPFQLARRDNPVTLPLFDDNPPIESGLQPESGATLKIYNYIDYLWKRKVNEFAEQFDCKVEISTFTTMDEAVAKLASGEAEFDVFFATVDRLGKLVAGKILQPLNLEYIPNLQGNIWPQLVDPFYDKGAQYTVPYVVWADGIGYRTDKVTEDIASLPNPYEIFWDGGYTGKTFLLDDYRDAIGMVLLRNGGTDVNTGDAAQLEQARADLIDLIDLVNIKVSAEDYSKVPEGAAWIHQSWSGSMIAAPYYLPQGVDASAIGFWYPETGTGVVGNDTMTVLRGADNPVLAHQFLNFMLDEKNAYENFYNYVGYQPPLNNVTPESLVADEAIPEHLASAVVAKEDYDRSQELLELAPDVDILWQNIWAEFKSGV